MDHTFSVYFRPDCCNMPNAFQLIKPAEECMHFRGITVSTVNQMH